MPTSAQAPAVPRLTYLRIKNYRALRDVEFRDLTPLTVLIGPNGSGKSTVLDALDFLAEAVRGNLTQAWEKRERFRGMRTQGSDGLIEFETEIWLGENQPRLSYKLSISESEGRVLVSSESLIDLKQENRRIFYLDNTYPNSVRRKGFSSWLANNIYVYDGKIGYTPIPSSTPYIARASFFAEQLGSQWPLLLEVIRLLQHYRVMKFGDNLSKGFSDEGARERLSFNGDNLTNVLYYYYREHPQLLEKIKQQLRRRVPLLAEVLVEITSDERLLLRVRDEPFDKPFPARFMSGGTLKLLALFTLLYEPDAEGVLGIEEPENEIHHLLLYQLAEDLSKATEKRQLLITSHSPFPLDALDPAQVWIIYRGADGYTHATRAADIPNVKELVEDGSPLGYLWSSNFFSVGNPLGPRSTPADAR